MGNESSKGTMSADVVTGNYSSVGLIYDPMDAKEFAQFIVRWRQEGQNRYRHMLVNAPNPLTGNIQRAYFLNFLDGGKMLVRWARYANDEPLLDTTDIVMTVAPAPEPFNPYIFRLQTVSYPIPLYAKYSEVELYLEREGAWIRGLIIAVEQLYYMFQPIDITKYYEVMSEYKEEQPTPAQLRERRNLMDQLTKNQRIRMMEQEKRQKEKAIFNLKLNCLKEGESPTFVRKNSALLRPVYKPDPFFNRFRDMLPFVGANFFDVGRILQSGQAEEYLKFGFWLRLNLRETTSEGSNMRDNFRPGLMDHNGRLEEIDPTGTVAPSSFFASGFFAKDEDQIAYCDKHVFNWKDANLLLEEHRFLEWENLLETRNRVKVQRCYGSKGTSLYHALSHQLFGTTDNWAFVRRVTLDYIKANKTYFEQFVDIDLEYYIEIKELGTESSFLSMADQLDIQAVCELFDACCEIYSPYDIAIENKRVKPHNTFYMDLNNGRSRDMRLPLIRLTYMGCDEYHSIYDNATPMPLKAVGGGVLGHRLSKAQVVYKARKEITKEYFTYPHSTTDVSGYAGYARFAQSGAIVDHMRAVFQAAGYRVDFKVDQTVFITDDVRLRIDDTAQYTLERLGILEFKTVKNVRGEESSVPVIAGEKILPEVPGQTRLSTHRVDFILEGLQEACDKFLKVIENYTQPYPCNYYCIYSGAHRHLVEVE